MRIKIDVSDGKNVFFTSDLHLYHKNVIKYDGRPFLTNEKPDLDLMHETLLNNWNNTVTEKDVVFNLGDLSFGEFDLSGELINKLNGKIHYIMGNHDDYKIIKSYNRFETINDMVDLTINDKSGKTHFVMCHYPIYSWNRAHYGSIMIHGHCHMSLSNGEFHNNKRIFDVGCNGWDYTPVSYLDIVNLSNKIDYKLNTHH